MNFYDWLDKQPQPDKPRNPKELAPFVTLDDIPSPTPIITGVYGNQVLMVIPVHGLGVVTLRSDESDPDTGRQIFKGVGIFTQEQIKPTGREDKYAI